ncbi:hypothetical protein TNCV_4264751 [Trichonephila clavipes]|nr:hypothetical protein TNCV_4264751 [Trichonephila clavipes]
MRIFDLFLKDKKLQLDSQTNQFSRLRIVCEFPTCVQTLMDVKSIEVLSPHIVVVREFGREEGGELSRIRLAGSLSNRQKKEPFEAFSISRSPERLSVRLRPLHLRKISKYHGQQRENIQVQF